ncbi:hypothetical protein KXD93_09450 [Mucilaginibacter sp. BJC16-A38]|uniref:hypothetical protein n=1 Tax=Mucilaginibacter phenanthrenivorans TaxID=1234842 RepID=UPI00215807A8|nr:hypothetical protein [Mucilaginibacter phenanthrenivorans]MCR8557866.1 hypothetical protein [Mucilaginibacter phenanthrenivorans]
MEDKDEFLKTMENLQVPDIDPRKHPKVVKMAIMNAERSAALGVWLIVVPCYFLFCVFMYYHFHAHMNWFSAMFALIVSMEKTPYLDFLAPIILVVLPIICIIINVLSIMHVRVDKPDPDQIKVREFSVTIKVKIWNIILILLSLAILFAFISFAMTESISLKN